MQKPGLHKAVLKEKKQLTHKIIELSFLIQDNDDFDFISGQFVNILVGDSVFRSYSIASNQEELPILKFVIETGHNGIGANYLNSLKPGDNITFIGPSGKLMLKKPLAASIYFMATGTGLSAFIPMLYELSKTSYSGNVHLYFGVRKEYDLFYEKFLESLKNELVGFDYSVFYSKPDSDNVTNSGRITKIAPLLKNKNSHYYICGHPEMVEEIIVHLKEKEIPEENIIKEEFTRSQR